MTSWTITQKWFWDRLIARLWQGRNKESTQDPLQRITNLHASMEWLAEFSLAELGNRRLILRAVEDSILNILRYLEKENIKTDAAASIFTAHVLNPFVLHGLLKEFDPIFQRLIGYVMGMVPTFTKVLSVTEITGESFDILFTQEEIERQACEILNAATAGQQPAQLRYLLPFHIGILLEHTVDRSGRGTADAQPLQVPIPQEVPLLFLPLAADASLRKQLFEHFHSWFEVAEPPLAKTIHSLLPGLITEDSAIAQKNLQDFYRTYLLSTHFQLMRDLVQGFDYLGSLDLEELDALCGEMPLWPQGASFQEVIETLCNVTRATQKDSAPLQAPSTWLLLQEPSRLAFAGARSSESLLNRYSEEQRFMLLSYWIETAEMSFDVFHSLVAGLALLLHAAYCFSNLKVLVGDTERLLREWLTEHLLKILRYKVGDATPHKRAILKRKTQLLQTSQPAPVTQSIPLDNEFLRRSIHAKLLRYAFRAVASPSHIQALNTRKAQTHEHDLIGELLIRGILLSHRLSILVDHMHIPLEEIEQRLTEVIASKGIPWSTLYLQDQFNPELYGPEAGQYDHLLIGTLAVFREVGIDQPTVEGTTGTSASVPFWLTPQVKRALIALANRPENEAERRVREARERGVPNRLQTFLDRTPQEYATELLRFASPGLAKEEEFLLKGRTQLLELLRQASDNVIIDIQPVSWGSEHPDMVARMQVGGEEQRILVEAKMSAEPRHLRHTISQLQQYVQRFSSAYGIIAVPSISERGGKLCEEGGVGYIDLQGNASIKFNGIFIRTVAAKSGKRQRGRTKTLFAPVSTRFVRALLTEPEHHWKLQELAAATHMSLGQAHKVKQALLDQEFVAMDRQRRLFVKEPSSLLDAWRETYRYEQNNILSLFSLEKLPTIEEKVQRYCDTRQVRYAFTLFSGASKLAPFVRSTIVACYVIGDVEDLIQEVQLKPVESGANVLLLSPYDLGILYGLQEAQGYKVVSTVQLYVDLYSYGGRGREQAEFLREKMLSF
jgi:hypothetical protein